MSNRIKISDLQMLIDNLNERAGSPLETYKRENGRAVAQIGNYHLSQSCGGVALYCVVNTSGGIHDIFSRGHMPKRELFGLIQAYSGSVQSAVKKLELLGRRWFDAKNGNTYFSAVALYNGDEIARIDYEYGYGDHWLDAITKNLVVNQLQRGENQVPWRFIEQLEQNGIAVFQSVQDVKRKKELAQ